MTHGVDRRDDDVGVGDLVRLHFDLRNPGGPCYPFSLDVHLKSIYTNILFSVPILTKMSLYLIPYSYCTFLKTMDYGYKEG